MNGLLGTLGTLLDLALVVLGFGLIIVIHELGHFLAAKWAGIRVLAFAVGFGPAAVSWRKGLGWRRGSSEGEYEALRRAEGEGLPRANPHLVSPTEYRLNWLPLGGYVKMLGQEDLNPGAVSAEPDGYQSCKPWKRMIVISAGVAMNLVLAAALFIFVFMVGLRAEPAKIGAVYPGLPASRAVAINADVAGVTEVGLRPGDVVASIDGRRARKFNDLALASAMARRGRAIELVVERPGVEAPLVFQIRPQMNRLTRLQELGVEPARSAMLFEARNEAERAAFAEAARANGLGGVEPGMTLVRAGADTEILTAQELDEAVRASGGEPVELEFIAPAPDARRVTVSIEPVPRLESDLVPMGPEEFAALDHVMGLTPVMAVAPGVDGPPRQGLEVGDVFARLGTLEYPSVPEGIAEIRRSRGKPIEVVVLRQTQAGLERIALTPRVSREGRIGFSAGDTMRTSTLLALPARGLAPAQAGGVERIVPAAATITRPGATILAVAGTPVENLLDVREALRRATLPAAAEGTGAAVPLEVRYPRGAGLEGPGPEERVSLALAPEDVRRLHALGWTSPVSIGLFKPEEALLKAGGPLEAIVMGVRETHSVMLTTYITFARLFEGTVRVEHLKGPVGIAHLGTRVAERGFIWLLFFLALISVNLAVINFLPLPIVDGGQFVLLVLEQVRGRPVPVSIQNAITTAGILLVGAVFLIVTFNDIANLFG